MKAALPTFTLAALLLLTTACVHHEPRPLKGFFKSKFTAIGHRGAKGVAPENTMAAFRASAAAGAPFELDTMLCKTGEPVVIHDYTVDRTTNGKGKVADLTLKELRALDAGSYFSPKFKGEKIPTLNEVLDEFANRVKVDIEIKYQGPREKIPTLAKAIIDLVKKKGLEKKVFITAFNPYVLEAFKNEAPDLARGQLYSRFETADIPYHQKVVLRNLLLNESADPDFLAPNYKMVDEEYVKTYHELGYKILVWTVNKPDDMRRLIEMGVDGIITDFPNRLKKVYKEVKGHELVK